MGNIIVKVDNLFTNETTSFEAKSFWISETIFGKVIKGFTENRYFQYSLEINDVIVYNSGKIVYSA